MTKGARSEIVKCEKTHQTILRDLPSQSGYLKENTWTELLPESTSPELLVGSSVMVYAPAIDGYTCVSANPQTITLKTEAAENIITFYYREATSTIPAGEPAKEPFNKNANPRQLNRDDHFAYIKGYPDGTFRPEQTIKRAEMVAMVNRALGRDPQSETDMLAGMKTWKDNADAAVWYYLDIQEATNGHTYARKTGGEYWTGLLADTVS